MSAELFVEVSGLAGDSIDEILLSMITLSNRLRTGITHNFNGIKICLYYTPKLNYQLRQKSLVDKYLQALRDKDSIICG